jgi:hypothetical protein
MVEGDLCLLELGRANARPPARQQPVEDHAQGVQVIGGARLIASTRPVGILAAEAPRLGRAVLQSAGREHIARHSHRVRAARHAEVHQHRLPVRGAHDEVGFLQVPVDDLDPVDLRQGPSDA